MPRYPQPQIEERYEKLPEVLKEAMFSPENADLMFEVGKKFGLTLDKIGYMAEETGYVILGFTKPVEFIKQLEENLDIDSEKAEEIAAEINHRVFLPLREALKQAHQVEIEDVSSIKYQVSREKETPPQVETKPTVPSLVPTRPTKPLLPTPPTPYSSPQPKLPQTAESAKIQLPKPLEQPKPAEPAKPMPIDLRELRKPAMPASLPEIIGPAKPSEIPKPPTVAIKHPEPAKPTLPKPVTPPRPEIMPGGGMFAAPIASESRITNHVSEVGKSKLSQPQNQLKEFKGDPHKFDPYREPIE